MMTASWAEEVWKELQGLEREVPSGIYGIYCTVNKKWYVGQAQNIQKRNREERRELTAGCCHNRHLQHAWDKYGADAFVWWPLFYCTVEELDHWETVWIQRLNSYENGFNMTTGGGGCRGYKHTEKWKKQASERNSNGRSPRKGKPLSAEAKARMRSKALGGNSPRAKAVYQIAENGEAIAIFDSIGDAERATGISGTHISEVCRGLPKRKTAGGFIWQYAGGDV